MPTSIRDIEEHSKILTILEVINKHGEENPVSSECLMQMFGLSERQLRQVISIARSKYAASIAAHPNGGYYRAMTWEQYKRTFCQRIGQALAEIQTQNAVRKALQRETTPTLFDTPMTTEYDDLIEIVENYIQRKE